VASTALPASEALTAFAASTAWPASEALTASKVLMASAASNLHADAAAAYRGTVHRRNKLFTALAPGG
jgi:hypothetical protein